MDTNKLMKTVIRRFSLQGLSIQQRLPLLICILLLGVTITFGLISYFAVRDNTLKIGAARLHSQSDQLTTLFSQSAQILIAGTRTAAEHESIKKVLKENPSPDEVREAVQNLQKDTTPVLIDLLDVNSKSLLRSGKNGFETRLDFNKALGNLFPEDTGRVGKIYLLHDSMYFPIVVAVIINNEIAGYLVKWRLVQNTQRSVDQIAMLMGTPAAKLYFGNSDNSLWTDMVKPVAFSLPAYSGKPGDVLKYTGAQGKVIAVAKPIKNTPWLLLSEISQKAVLEPANNFLRTVIIIACILISIGIFLAWTMSRNITRPLNKLTAAAAAIANGDYSTTVAVDRKDEVGKLARAFNAMIGQVSKARQGLEQKVIEAGTVNEQLRNLSAHLQNIREDERKHIAREMHDELGQLLTGFKMDVSWLGKQLEKSEDPVVRERLAGMTAIIDESVKFVRKIAAELRPSILDDLGLVAALEWYSREFEKRYNIKIEFRSQVQELNASSLVATGLFRMYQESLTNVARHSGADKVLTTLQISRDHICLSIRDNGKGFVTTPQEKKTLGLLGMKERAIMIGGKLEIRSEPGKGTTIEIEIPLLVPA
jgi:signal transduction histidine kinase